MARDSRRWWILGVLCFSVWILVMDNTVLNLAVPVLMGGLGAGPDDVQWIINAYALAFAGMLLTAGSLSDRYGRRLFLVLGLAVFGCASLAASLSAEPWHLVVARAFMGVGGAMLMPSTLSILVNAFEAEERRKAFAAWSAAAMFGLVVGPLVGGFVLEHARWGMIFLLNLPVVVLAIAVAVRLIPESKGPARRLDPVGVLSSAVGMIALIHVVISLPRAGWAAPSSLVAVPLAVASLSAFIWWERRTDHPMLPLSLFRDRRFGVASFTIVLVVFGSGALLLVLAQYLQFVRGISPVAAGLDLLPYVVASVLGNVAGGALGKRTSNQLLIAAGFAAAAVGFVLLAFIDSGADGGLLAGGLVIMGVGVGLAGPAAYTLLMGVVPEDHAGVGSALNDTVQQLGTALSVAVLGSVLAWKYSSSMPADTPLPARESIAAALDTGDAALVAAAKSAFLSGMSLTLVIGAACCVVAMISAMSILRFPSAGQIPDTEAGAVQAR
ncbi:MFS transporter [Nonomuraea sp. 3-1Str]|uniref:MFS transporter n=1 Tax=Nonomuraea sp. 3-1Str TaxID=2929801 RepID=UPI0028640016|nr:MFS transporter [Nonomuraea sp. 3-1Str]MDR8414079.1 MFS transporter [Nonomuraea sp. 3-1Str]